MRLLFLRLLLTVLRIMRTRAPAVLALLAFAVLAVGPYAFAVEAHAAHVPMRWHEGLYYTFGLFTMQGNPLGYPHTLLLVGLYYVAPLVSASALLGAIARLLEDRAPLLLRRFRHHTVIGGLRGLGATIARHEGRHGRPFVAVDRDPAAPDGGQAGYVFNGC